MLVVVVVVVVVVVSGGLIYVVLLLMNMNKMNNMNILTKISRLPTYNFC